MADTKDNTDENVHFFEGVEKLLEIWFVSSKDLKQQQGDLRQIPRQKWESLMKIVRCEIISSCHTDLMDAYVLSESSMFVSKRRLILKTCGTTTPLQCLKSLLELVKEYTHFDDVENVFYSRKNYKKPQLQISPHQTFEEEVALLKSLFPGEAYCIGSPKTDCWFLYTLIRDTPRYNSPEPDQTLEILMTHLDPDVMSIFTKDVCSSANEATVKSGIDKLIPNMMIDDFLFVPYGYSMNGISKSGNYMTIHITPEPEFSYVSFECNVPQASYDEMIRRVINTFKPGKFVVTIFANKQSVAADCPYEFKNRTAYVNCPGDWLRTDVQYYRFPNNTIPETILKSADAVRSVSSSQLMTAMKPARSKVYRKTSLKCEIDGDGSSDDVSQRKGVRYVSTVAEKKQKRRSLAGKETITIAKSESTKWNPEDVHITCNPLSTPYPYSTPLATTTTTTATTVTTASKTTTERDDEPKSHSCGSFLPILALIPQSIISFQYLSPKMKFSWWRNKIS